MYHGYYYGFDTTYLLLVVPALLIALIAQIQVKSAFSRYARVRCTSGLTGAQAAQRILQANGITDVRIEHITGKLTDHFDPQAKVIRLSDEVYGVASIAAVGVAAHEAGHAVQYATDYAPIRIRAAIIPATRIGSNLSWPLLIAGLTLCISASPQSVNRNCPDQKQLACPPDVTVASLYAAFAEVDTPLGKPFLGRIKTIDGDVMIWGPNALDEYVYLYRSRSGRYLHLSSNIFPEWITTPIPAGEKKDEQLDMPELLADLCDCIEDYLKTGNVRPL